jgi:cleavage and polyadenylation specificity factor subunit 1
MYCIEKTLHSPTAVEHSLYCNFYNDQEKNLVVAGGNQLKVYRLVTFESSNSSKSIHESNEEQKQSLYQVKLECRHTFQVFGEISSIGHVRLGRSNRDALLLSFLEAKLSIVEYDPSSHDLKTLALHNLEQDQLKGGLARNVYPPVVRYDPEQRCCAVLCFGRSIVIVPFKKHESNNVEMDAVDISLLNTSTPATSLSTVPVTYSANEGTSKNHKPVINLK